MGFFNLFRRHKKETPPEEEYLYKGMTVDDALSFTASDGIVTDEAVAKMTRTLCEQINTFRAYQEETKHEYGIVTEYLADIQRIESMPDKDKCEVMDAARMILGLDDERYRYQNNTKRMPTELHRCMAMYEDDIPGRLKEMRKQEEYLELVRTDMQHISGETDEINATRTRALGRMDFLRKVAYGVLGIALFTFIVLLLLMSNFGKEFMLSFFITGAATMAFIAYYVVEHGKLRDTVRLCDRKLGRATQLMNKVKLKFVNTSSTLDYSYEKYHVSSVDEFSKVWEAYVREKDEEKRYRRNTELLNNYQEELSKRLTEAGVVRPDAWVYAPEALLSRSDMEVYKDGIGRRRRKLRAQIDFNNKQQAGVMNDIDTLRKKYPDHAAAVDKVVAENLEA